MRRTYHSETQTYACDADEFCAALGIPAGGVLRLSVDYYSSENTVRVTVTRRVYPENPEQQT